MYMKLLALCCLLGFCLCKTGTLKVIDGQLTNVVDDCDPNDPHSCGAGQCCVKQGMAYIPEATGPKPAYVLQCRPLSAKGRACYLNVKSHEMCPCASGLTCKAGVLGFFGHCQ